MFKPDSAQAQVPDVPLGTRVNFRNDDALYHNVFSLSRPNEFDLGMYKQGLSRSKIFDTPGPVSLLCNVHSAMSAYVFVVDTPYYAQADWRGNFALRNVPPGQYTLRAWHELASSVVEKPVTVGTDSLNVALTIDADKSLPAFVPDKTGKPRQPQLGY